MDAVIHRQANVGRNDGMWSLLFAYPSSKMGKHKTPSRGWGVQWGAKLLLWWFSQHLSCWPEDFLSGKVICSRAIGNDSLMGFFQANTLEGVLELNSWVGEKRLKAYKMASQKKDKSVGGRITAWDVSFTKWQCQVICLSNCQAVHLQFNRECSSSRGRGLAGLCLVGSFTWETFVMNIARI